MSAYMIADVGIISGERYESYRVAVRAAIERNGGRYLVRGGDVTVIEGTWDPERLVVVEFPTLEQAESFYKSPEYLEARTLRQNAAMVNMILIDGTADQPISTIPPQGTS
jgi:uncharacterized protein (DUF1330 family)